LENQTQISSQFDLLTVKDFLDVHTRGTIIDEMRRSSIAPASTYGKGEAAVDERVRRTSRMSPSIETVRYVNQRLEEYRETVERHFAVDLGGCEEPQFLCYRTGDFFVAHQDGNTGLINLETDRTRRVSVSIFLNQQSANEQNEGYGGGSLVFSDWRTTIRHQVCGEAGALVAFRSETTHEIMPVTHGERYAIVSWYGRRTNA